MLVLRTAYLENNGYAISYCIKALGGMSQVFKNQIGINFYTMGKLLFIHKSAWVGAWNVSANNSETVGHKYLRLGQIVYILVFYNISF